MTGESYAQSARIAERMGPMTMLGAIAPRMFPCSLPPYFRASPLSYLSCRSYLCSSVFICG